MSLWRVGLFEFNRLSLLFELLWLCVRYWEKILERRVNSIVLESVVWRV